MPDSLAGRLRNILKKSESTPVITQSTAQPAPPDTEPEEPTSLALRIQALVGNLPTPTKPTPVKNPKPPRCDKHGRPIPPEPPINDSKLIAALNSATIMNGSRDETNSRPSIWSILESLGAPKHHDDTSSPDPDRGRHGTPDVFSDISSIMIYSPLLPTRDSLVELASSEAVVEDAQVDGSEHIPDPPIAGWSWANMLPSLSSWLPQGPTQTLIVEDVEPLTPRTRELRLRAQATKVWVPSRDKLSIQTMWWGYHLFLPPPVLDILDDKQLEAAKRAAMITSALTWLFNNLPVNSLPLAIRPAVLLLQRISPYLGYIGTFISWSWSTIKSYDQGFGVILTATWLLPVALVPGTWFERDWPVSPPSSTSPLPPEPQPPATSPSSPPNQTPSSPTPAPTPTPAPAPTPAPVPPSTSPPQAPSTLPSIPVASPFISFATTPISAPNIAAAPPTVTSPKRIHRSLAGLVARTPIVRAHRSQTKTTPPPPSLHSKPSQTGSQTSAPPTASSTSPTLAPSTPNTEDLAPSPPANPNDLRLLQSPIMECSPLPSEHARHPALPAETDQNPSREGRKRKKGVGMGFLKSRR